MAKFYAVKGEENLIFKKWEDCKFFIEGKKGYKYKSFSTEEEAMAYLEDRDYYAELLETDRNEGYVIAFTDGSFEESLNRYSYGAITVSPSGEEQTFCGSGENPDFLSSRNIAGEVEGVLSAVKWAFFNGYERLKIYHDYEGLSAWAEGRWNAGSAVSRYYIERLNKYKGVVDITFSKVKGHSNNKYNELVDQLAKDALFNGRTETLSGKCCKISGTYYFDDMIKWLNRQAPKAKLVQKQNGVVFNLEDEWFASYVGITACSMIGSGDYLYNLALCYFLENHKDIAVNRLIERFFDIDTDENRLNGSEMSRISINMVKDNKAPAIIFALFELEREIREFIGAKDKISPYFEKIGDSFSYKGETEDDLICEAYKYFYNYRKSWFSISIDEKEAELVIQNIENLTNELKRRKNGR